MNFPEVNKEFKVKFNEMLQIGGGGNDEAVRKLLETVASLEERVSEMENNNTSGGSAARIGYITLLADKWVGKDNLYSQIVSVDGVTENSQVDLTPSVEQLEIFYEKDIAFVTENENGVVTVYVIGQKPQNDYTIQVTMTEVAYE